MSSNRKENTLPSTSNLEPNVVTLRFQRNSRADLQRIRARIDELMADKDVERGTRIRQLRQRSAYRTQDALFAKLYPQVKTKKSIHNWEKGYNIERKNVELLAEVLGTTVEYIYNGEQVTEQAQLDRLETQVTELQTKIDAILKAQEEFVKAFRQARPPEGHETQDETPPSNENPPAGDP